MFVLSIMADDRAVAATYVAGEPAYTRSGSALMSTGHAGYAHATTTMFGDRTSDRPRASAARRPGRSGSSPPCSWSGCSRSRPAMASSRRTSSTTPNLTIAQVGLAASIYTLGVRALPVLLRLAARPLRHPPADGDRRRARDRRARSSTPRPRTSAPWRSHRSCWRSGPSFGFVGAGYLGGKWFEAAKYGLMFGLVQMFASLGSAVSQPAISALLHHMTWQQLLAGFGAFGVLLVVAFVFIVRNPVSTPEQAAAAAAERHGNVFGEIVHDLGACFAQPPGRAVRAVRRRIVRDDARGRCGVGTTGSGGPRRQCRVSRPCCPRSPGSAWPSARRSSTSSPTRWHSRKWPAVLRHAPAGRRRHTVHLRAGQRHRRQRGHHARRRPVRRHPHARLHRRRRIGATRR